MGCGLSQEERERQRYLSIASKLPFLKGTIISTEGEPIDISDIFGLEVSEADPQLKKAQPFTPFVKDTILLQNGRVCSLLDLINKLFELINDAGVVYTSELRLTYVPLSEEDW